MSETKRMSSIVVDIGQLIDLYKKAAASGDEKLAASAEAVALHAADAEAALMKMHVAEAVVSTALKLP